MFRLSLVVSLLSFQTMMISYAQSDIVKILDESFDQVRQYGSQSFTKHIFTETGSGTYMTGISFEEAKKKLEEQIRKAQESVKIEPKEIELVFHFIQCIQLGRDLFSTAI